VLLAPVHEFVRPRDGVRFALEGGIWLHHHRYRGEPMAHVVSADKDALLALGRGLALDPTWLQYKPLKHPSTGVRAPAWHWDLRGARLAALAAARPSSPGGASAP